MFESPKRPATASKPLHSEADINDLLNADISQALKKNEDEKKKPVASGKESETQSGPSAKSGEKLDGMAAMRRMNEKIKQSDAIQAASIGADENDAFAAETKKAQETPILTQLWNTAKNTAKSAASGLQATRAELDTYLGGIPALNLDAVFGGEGDLIVRSDSDQEKLLKSAQDLKNSATGSAITSTSQLRPLSTAEGWKDLLALTGNAFTQAGIQIPATIATKGLSSAVQTNGQIYLDGVERLAASKGKTPMQLIKDGEDEKLIPLVAAGLSAAFDNIGAKGVKDAILTSELKAVLRNRAVKVFTSSGKEGLTETGQTIIEDVSTSMAGGSDFSTAVSELDPQKLKDAAVQGTLGAGALSTVGATANAILSTKAKTETDNPAGAYVPPTTEQTTAGSLQDTETLSQTSDRFHKENADIVAETDRMDEKASEDIELLNAQIEGNPEKQVAIAEKIADKAEKEFEKTEQNDATVQETTARRDAPQPDSEPIQTGSPLPERAADTTPPSDMAPLAQVPEQTGVNPALSDPDPIQDTTQAEQTSQPQPRVLSVEEELRNKLVGLTNDYNNLNNRLKNGAEGARIRQQIMNLTADTSMQVAQEQGRIVITEQNGKPIQRTSLDTPTSEAQNFIPLEARAESAQPFIRKGVEAAFENPSIFHGLGLNLSSEDIQGAVSDIEAGKNTNRSQKLLDVLENAHKDGFFRQTVRKGTTSVTYDIPSEEYFVLAKEAAEQNNAALQAMRDMFRDNTFTIDDVLSVATSDNPRNPNRFESTLYEDLNEEQLSEFIDLLTNAKNEQEQFAATETPAADNGTTTGIASASDTTSQNQGSLPTDATGRQSTTVSSGRVAQPVVSQPVTQKPPTKPGESQFAKSVIDYGLLTPEQLSKDPVLYQIGSNQENLQSGLDLLSEVGEQDVYNRLSNYVTGNESFRKGELKRYAVAGMLLVKGWENARQKALQSGDSVLSSQLAQNIADLVPQLSQAFTDGGQFVQVASLLDMVKSMDQVVFKMADKAVTVHNEQVRNTVSEEQAQDIAAIIAEAKREAKAEIEAARKAQSAPLTPKGKKEVQKRIFDNRKKAKKIIAGLFKDLDNNPCF